MKRTGWLMAAVLLAFTMPVATAYGWIITQVDPNASAGYSAAVIVPYTSEPTRDVFEIHKFFIKDPESASIPLPLVLAFTREEGDKDTICIVDEIILNLQVSQDRTWDDFHVAVLGTDPISFIDPWGASAWQQTGGASRLGGSPSGVITYFGGLGMQIDWVDANQPVPCGTFANAPTNQLVLRGLEIDVSAVPVGDTFLLKEWPTVPEPCTMAFLALGGAAVVIRRRRR